MYRILSIIIVMCLSTLAQTTDGYIAVLKQVGTIIENHRDAEYREYLDSSVKAIQAEAVRDADIQLDREIIELKHKYHYLLWDIPDELTGQTLLYRVLSYAYRNNASSLDQAFKSMIMYE